ncbi:Serine/arginine-rich splicing factor 7 [Aphelenchoides besseyi]|nr:Serine/arginine-rich splicing factor 7 [Aphelenchoides besseyi]KAI6209961.1 Serine/arginine-rich splicing factor 7 [Aphelenchoides besseyi]
MSRRGEFLDAKVYIGGLPEDATTQEIEDAFHRFGRIRKVWVARRPPGFAFVEFEDSRDAEDAVKAMDGNRICGVRARVELSHGRRRNGAGNQGGGGGYSRGSGGGPPSSRRRSRSRSPYVRHYRRTPPRGGASSRSPSPRR